MKPLFLSRHQCQSRMKILGIVVLSIFGWCPPGWCQTEQDEASDKSAEGPEFQYTVHFASESGLDVLVPEKWGVLRASLMNGRSEPRDLLCSTYFDQDPSLQYGRQVWIPAHSKLRIDHPILIPKCDPVKGRSLDLHSLVIDRSSSNEVLVRGEGEGLLSDGALMVTHHSQNTAIIGKPSGSADARPDEIADLVKACRAELRLGNNVTWLGEAFLPPDEIGLDALDHIVVADDRIVNDLAATAALRRWLNSGGHLWIMLDRVDPVLLSMLLGDDFAGYVVDRVGLTSVRVDEAPVLSGLKGMIGETVEYDDPVDLVRMAVADVNVTHVVNGWPAAITIPCGDGKLLITTLGARGWMRTWPEGAVRPSDPLMTSNFRPSEPMANVSDNFFRLRKPELLHSGAIEPQTREYIGYSVLSWSLIVGTLLGFSASIVAIGIWLLRCGRLERICWFASIPALAASLFLIQAGRINRQGITATMASVQLIEAIRGTDDLRCEGVLSTYQPDGSEFPIEATQGGRMMPDMTGMEQTSRRMVTTDLDAFHWENLRQTAGVRSTSFKQSQAAVDRLQAHATFDSHGLTGRYSGLVPPGTDAIVAARNGRMGATLKSDGTFDVRGDDVFEKDQYLSAGLLSDEQDRRRRTLKELLDNPERPDYPGRPQLMFWSEPRDNGFRFGEDLKNLGASLVVVPLVIQRPANGTEILIPSPFLNYVSRLSPDGTQPSAMWDADKKQWQERSTPGLAWLGFQIPHELLPLAPGQASIDLKVSGPIGRVEILGLKNGNVVSLKSIMNPVGSLSIVITDSEALTIDDQGHLALGLSAGNPDSPDLPQGTPDGVPPQASSSTDLNAKVNYWRIESLALQLSAKTTEPTAKD